MVAKRTEGLSLHKEPHGGDKGQWVQIALVKILSLHKKEMFKVRPVSCWNNLFRDVLESSSVEVFKMEWHRLLDNVI